MGDDPPHDDTVPWREELTRDQSATKVEVGTTAEGTVVVITQSLCAACHSITVKRTRRVLPSGSKGPSGGQDPPPVPAELTRLTFLCDCGYQHPDRPPGEYGCGRYWQVSLT